MITSALADLNPDKYRQALLAGFCRADPNYDRQGRRGECTSVPIIFEGYELVSVLEEGEESRDPTDRSESGIPEPFWFGLMTDEEIFALRQSLAQQEVCA